MSAHFRYMNNILTVLYFQAEDYGEHLLMGSGIVQIFCVRSAITAQYYPGSSSELLHISLVGQVDAASEPAILNKENCETRPLTASPAAEAAIENRARRLGMFCQGMHYIVSSIPRVPILPAV